MPLLLAHLGIEHPTSTQTSAGDFIKAIITISANASQNEQSCIGPNSLTRQLVSEQCIESLIADMLHGGNPLTVGVGIIIEVIRKNNSDYDPDVGGGSDLTPSSSDPIYLGTLLRLFAKNVPDFMDLILSPNHTVSDGDTTMTVKRKELKVAFGTSIEPLGFDRFKTCELMAELLHCSNMGLLNERGSEAFVKQRDVEREKLKAAGAFSRYKEPQSAVTDFSEDSNGYQYASSPVGLGSGSPEEIRRLEVANSAEDDGFEDVGASGDLSDEIKDDFDEKSPFELESNVAQLTTTARQPRRRLDLDEEFFDEPLTSPRLVALDETERGLSNDSAQLDANLSNQKDELTAKLPPLSPTSTTVSDINDVSVKEPHTPTSSQLSSIFEEPHADHPTEEDGTQALEEKSTLGSEVPPLPHRNPGLTIQVGLSDSYERPILSPHPGDKPAPLFADRMQSVATAQAPVEPFEDANVGPRSGSQDTIDTTLGEEGDSGRSLLHPDNDNDPNFTPHMENDVDGKPIVGDFLKIMFVEHQVVPTILVCSI